MNPRNSRYAQNDKEDLAIIHEELRSFKLSLRAEIRNKNRPQTFNGLSGQRQTHTNNTFSQNIAMVPNSRILIFFEYNQVTNSFIMRDYSNQ